MNNFFAISILKILLLIFGNILLYLILVKARKSYLDIFQAPDADYHKFLHYYYITNFYRTILKSIAYISLAFIVFFLFRFNRLNININLYDAQANTLSNNFIYILQIFSIILLLLTYRLVLQELFFREILKLHIYMYKYSFYEPLRMYIAHNLNNIFEDKILSNITSFIFDFTNADAYELWDKFNAIRLQEQHDHSKYRIMRDKIDRYFIPKLYSAYTANPDATWVKILLNLKTFLWHIKDSRKYFKYIVETFILVIFCYDLYHHQIYLIFYGLLYYFIVQVWRKTKRFAETKDPVLDTMLYEYFYKGPYYLIGEKEEKRILELAKIGDEDHPEVDAFANFFDKRNHIDNYQLHLTQYILTEFTVSYYVEIAETEAENLKTAKYRYIFGALLTTVLGICYLYNAKYTLIILGFQLPFNIITFPLIISFWCIYKTTEITAKMTGFFSTTVVGFKLFKKRILVFNILLCGYIMLFAYLYIKNNVPIYITETIFNNFIITLEQKIPLEQKIEFIQRYLKKTINIVSYSKEILLDLPYFENLSFQELRKILTSYVIELKSYNIYIDIPTLTPGIKYIYPEFLRFISNSIMILAVTTTLNQISILIEVSYQLYTSFNDTSTEIVKEFIKHYFR